MLGDHGLQLMGGKSYIHFKADLVDTEGGVTDETVRKFLKAFIDRFAAFAGKLAPQRQYAA